MRPWPSPYRKVRYRTDASSRDTSESPDFVNYSYARRQPPKPKVRVFNVIPVNRGLRGVLSQPSLANSWSYLFMENRASGRIEAELAHRFEDRMEAGLIADGLVSLWQEIDGVLCPIIGQRGVIALYQRSLHLTARTHPWLAGFHNDGQTSPDYTHLKALLIQRQCADLIVVGGLLFKTFYELLVSLVGPSLTERLLRSVGANLFSGPPAQDCP